MVPFECSVCFESMLNKDPRVLTCGHTFCFPCIQELAKKPPICCPKCRETTKLSDGKVEQLTKNIELASVTDFIENLKTQMNHSQYENFCSTCLRNGKKESATHFCADCPQKLICASCADMHVRFPPLKSHNVQAITTECCDLTTKACLQHQQPLQYFCTVCKHGLCIDCMYKEDHSGHEDSVTDFESGVQMFRKDLTSNLELGKQTNIVKYKIKAINRDLTEMSNTLSMLGKTKNVLKDSLQHVQNYMKTIKELQEPLNAELKSLSDSKEMASLLTKQWHHIDRVDDYVFLNQVKQLEKQTEELMKKMKEHCGGYKTAAFTPGNIPSALHVGRLEIVARQSDLKGKELSTEPELETEIVRKGDLLFPNLREIVPVDDGSVVVVCYSSRSLQRINTSGKVIKEYEIGEKVQSATVSDGFLFIAVYGNKIMRLALDESVPRSTYRPKSDCVSRVAASEKGILFTEHRKTGNLVEYDTENQTTTIQASKLNFPWFLSSAMINGRYSHVLYEKTENKFNVYDSNWILKSSINQRGDRGFESPCGVTLTPAGKILVADRTGEKSTTISEYSLEGTYIRDLLHLPSITCTIMYDYPYLWVVQSNSIKIFHVDY